MTDTLYNELTVSDFTIRIYQGPIGCSVSGGADSSLLMYVLMKYAPGPLTFYTTDSKPWPNRIAGIRKVYDKCIELTQRHDTRLVETVIEGQQARDNIFLTPKKDVEDKKINVCYTGMTRNPTEDLGHDDEKMTIRDGEPNKEVVTRNFYVPFINSDKKTVAQLYRHFDLMESLYPLTFSCTKSTTDKHCNSCWWCAERKWAFGRLI